MIPEQAQAAHDETLYRQADMWTVRWGANAEGIKPLKLCFKLTIDMRADVYSFSLPAEDLNDPHLKSGMLQSMASCERPDFPVAESERAGVLAAPDHLHFRASVRQIERYEAGSSEDARRIPRCLNGCCPELRKLTIGYLAGPD